MWTAKKEFSFNLSKAQALVIPANQSFHHNINIQIGSSSLSQVKTSRNLGTNIDNQSFSKDITLTCPLPQPPRTL